MQVPRRLNYRNLENYSNEHFKNTGGIIIDSFRFSQSFNLIPLM